MKLTPTPRETIYKIIVPTVDSPAPIVLNVEFKEQGKLEHLANFAYNKLKDPPLMFAVTTLWWILVIFIVKIGRSKRQISKHSK